MGNCIGKKSQHHRYSSKILPSLSDRINNEENILQYSSDQLFKSNHILKDSNTLRINEEDITMGYLFSKEKNQQEIILESYDTSLSPSFDSISCNSTSFSSEDQLILSSSSSSIDRNPIQLSKISKNEIFSLISRSNKNFFPENLISHNFKTLSSIIDNIIQQEFIQIHRQTKTILIEYNDKNIFNKYFHSFLMINLTYHLIQICFNEINKKNNLFGYISQIHSNRIQQIIINNSKLNSLDEIQIEYTNFYFILRVHSWPNEIRSIYEKRQRLWPLNIENLFNKTCFIRYNKTEGPTNDQYFNYEQMSWSYTYTAIESELVMLMSDGHKHFASIVWNYLNGKSEGEFSFNIFKHTLFYFFEQYSSDSFIITNDLFNYISLFIDYLFNRLQTKFLPHYFNSNSNLYNENISINLISFKMNYLDFKNFSIYILPKSSMYLYHLMYLMEFQSKFLQCFYSSKTNLTQTILDTHELVIKQLSLGVKTYKRQLDFTIAIQSHRPLTLDCLYRYQEENVQMIIDYLPLLRVKEPSLLVHSFWSIFIQYFNSLFDDLFIS